MKKFKHLLIIALVCFSANVSAQTAEEIIANYFENTGGIANWEKVEGIKIFAKVNQQGMEIPVQLVQLKGGKQMTVINFQGKEMKQNVFDGETLWSTNFMTQKAEKSDKETTDNMKLEMNDFPDPFLNYKEKGYSIELIGNETIDGADTYKLKLTKEPLMVDGKTEENVSYYYFDTENFVPIAVQTEIKTGPNKGMTSEITMSDYQEVSGVYVPHAMTQGIKGQPGQPIMIEKIEINPSVDPSVFMFPIETETENIKN